MSANLRLTQITDKLREKNIPLALLKFVRVDENTDVNKTVEDLESDYEEIKKYQKSGDEKLSQDLETDLDVWAKSKTTS